MPPKFDLALEQRLAYDAMNRLTDVAQVVGGTTNATASYQYDLAGRLQLKSFRRAFPER